MGAFSRAPGVGWVAALFLLLFVVGAVPASSQLTGSQGSGPQGSGSQVSTTQAAASQVSALQGAAFQGAASQVSRPSDGGRWWSVGLGAGSTEFTCDICARDRDAGALVRAAYGGTARPGLRVGVTGGGWTRVDDDVRSTVYQAGLLTYLEPRPGSRFHLIGGLGWSGYRSGGFRYDAAALTLGAGIDFPVSGPWVLSNDLLLDAASFGSLRNDGEVAARDVGLSVLRLEVVLTRR